MLAFSCSKEPDDGGILLTTNGHGLRLGQIRSIFILLVCFLIIQAVQGQTT